MSKLAANLRSCVTYGNTRLTAKKAKRLVFGANVSSPDVVALGGLPSARKQRQSRFLESEFRSAYKIFDGLISGQGSLNWGTSVLFSNRESELIFRAYLLALSFPLAKHHKLLSVRINSSPSEAAREALVGSLTELVANNSNFGPARRTKTSPDWFGT